MRELFLILLGIMVGALMSGWSIWTIVNYHRSDPKGRHSQRFHYRLAWPIGIIGMADLLKVLRDLAILLS